MTEPRVDEKAIRARYEPKLPVSSLDEALPLLRRPYTPEAVKFKVQTVFNGNRGCIVVSYIDARLVIERLNAVVGGEWRASYREADGGVMWCYLAVLGTERCDVGKANGIEAEKARVSDSLKRAAVHFGVGVSVYAIPQITLMNTGENNWLRESGGQKKTLVLTDDGRKKLREGYAKWLKGQTNFGEPLDHGDVADAGGMEDEPEAEEFVAERPAPLTDEKAKELRARIEKLYQGVDHERVPPGRFQAWLGDAAHSHAELERLAMYLEGLRP